MQKTLASFSVSVASFKTSLEQASQQTAELSRIFSYIANRYGSMTAALPYSNGGWLSPGMNWVTAPKGSVAVNARDDFSADDLPLTIGSYVGVRYWKVPKTYGPEGPVAIQQAGPLWVRVSEYYGNAKLPPGESLYMEGMWGAWSPGENTAHCRPAGCADSTVPSRSCSCGFWAYWETQEAGRHMSAPDVVGVIEGYGHVIAGSAGFRCSKARVAALCVLPADPGFRDDVMTRLHETYSVPIYPDPETMLRAHPPTKGRVAEWAAKRPEDAAAARQYALPFPLVTDVPSAIPAKIPCVICGQLAPGGAACEECSELSSLAACYSMRFTCSCGKVRTVALDTLMAAKGGKVRYRCHCGHEMTLEPPKLTPQQALTELKRRAGNWTVH